MVKEDKSNLVNEPEEEHNESNENGYVGDREAPAKSTAVRLCGNWKLEGLTLVILVVVIFSIAVTVAMVIHILVGPPQVVPHGSAASMSKLCSKAAVEIMNHHGGNGVDGAVAGALCESVTLPHRTGLGGGALMFVYSQKGRNATLLDCRESAPSASTNDMFSGKNDAATSGGLSVAVPGFLRCLYASHKQFGKIAWSSLFQPAIKIAKQGFPMPSDLSELLSSNSDLLDKVKASPVLSKLYLSGDKSALAAGTSIKRTAYAKLLEKLAGGSDTLLYHGDIAAEIVDAVSSDSGIMTTADLSAYEAKKKKPLRGHFNHFTILTFPLPSIGGPLMLGTLNALDAYGIYRSLLSNETSIPNQVKAPNALYYQRLVEILRQSLYSVDQIGATSNASSVAQLITVKAAKQLIAKVKANQSATLTGNQIAPVFELPAGDSSLSVQGSDNTIVSISSTLGSIFGSGVVTSSDIVLNNAMGAFSLPDVTPVNSNNLPGPNKRPLTPLSPFVAHNPRRRCGVRFGAGSSQGLTAPQACAQVAIAALLWDVPTCREKDCLDLKAAIKRPRFSALPNNQTVEYEPGIPADVLKSLKANGHIMKEVPNLGSVEAAGEVQHVVTAYSDRRSGGVESSY